MQMMLDKSEEFGSYKGLGLIPGQVVAIPSTSTKDEPHKIPHIGWNGLISPAVGQQWDNTILAGVNNGDAVYFVHSFMSVPDNQNARLADCNYNGRMINAVIQSENLYGCQFHPEKSGEVGLKTIKNFMAI
jgi:glutamine amidotransferase